MWFRKLNRDMIYCNHLDCQILRLLDYFEVSKIVSCKMRPFGNALVLKYKNEILNN